MISCSKFIDIHKLISSEFFDRYYNSLDFDQQAIIGRYIDKSSNGVGNISVVNIMQAISHEIVSKHIQ